MAAKLVRLPSPVSSPHTLITVALTLAAGSLWRGSHSPHQCGSTVTTVQLAVADGQTLAPEICLVGTGPPGHPPARLLITHNATPGCSLSQRAPRTTANQLILLFIPLLLLCPLVELYGWPRSRRSSPRGLGQVQLQKQVLHLRGESWGGSVQGPSGGPRRRNWSWGAGRLG